MGIWKSRIAQGIAALLLEVTILIVLWTTVPAPLNAWAVGSTLVAFLLLVPKLLEDKESPKDHD